MVPNNPDRTGPRDVLALRVALAVLDLQPNDEVITQSFTFVATAEAIIESRAVPVCCEIDDTFNMDPNDLLLLVLQPQLLHSQAS